MEPLILNIDNLDLNKIIFTELKKNSKGGYSSNIKYINNNTNLYLQTPVMFCPFGVTSFGINKKYTINLSFENKKNNKKLDKLYDKFINLDILVQNKIKENKEWFNIVDNYNNLENYQTPLVKYSKNNINNPPYLNIKLNSNINNIFFTEIFDFNKNRILCNLDNIENILKPCIYLKSLLHIVGVWFLNGKFGITLRALQFILCPNEKLSGFSFIDLSDDEMIDEIDTINDNNYMDDDIEII